MEVYFSYYDARDLDKGGAHVINISAGKSFKQLKDDYSWVERYVPYCDPHWFIPFVK